MKGLLHFKKMDDGLSAIYNLEYDKNGYGYIASIRTDLDKEFEQLVVDASSHEDFLDLCIKANLECGFHEKAKFFMNSKTKFDELIRDASFITFDFDLEEVYDYVMNNPSLLDKKIVINVESYSTDMVDHIKEVFGDNTDSLYFAFDGNSGLVNFEEYSDTICAINVFSEEVSKFDFSPLEKIMYVYDMVRDRVYSESSSNKLFSRDLSYALLGEDIVCVGYSNIFKAVLNRLGMDSNLCFYDSIDDTSGHVINEVRVIDPKYDVDGVYYFDLTNDSKKDNDIDFLDSYQYFMMTKDDTNYLDTMGMKDSEFPYYVPDLSMTFINYIGDGFFSTDDPIFKVINHMGNVINGEPIISPIMLKPSFKPIIYFTRDDIYRRTAFCEGYFNKRLSYDTFISLLNNVRKKEHYAYPDKYAYDLDTLERIGSNSLWDRSFSNNPDYSIIRDDKLETLGITRDIEGVELTKVLKKELECKSN